MEHLINISRGWPGGLWLDTVAAFSLSLSSLSGRQSGWRNLCQLIASVSINMQHLSSAPVGSRLTGLVSYREGGCHVGSTGASLNPARTAPVLEHISLGDSSQTVAHINPLHSTSVSPPSTPPHPVQPAHPHTHTHTHTHMQRVSEGGRLRDGDTHTHTRRV